MLPPEALGAVSPPYRKAPSKKRFLNQRIHSIFLSGSLHKPISTHNPRMLHIRTLPLMGICPHTRLNPSTAQPLNSSTPQQLNASTPQQLNPLTPLRINLLIYMLLNPRALQPPKPSTPQPLNLPICLDLSTTRIHPNSPTPPSLFNQRTHPNFLLLHTPLNKLDLLCLHLPQFLLMSLLDPRPLQKDPTLSPSQVSPIPTFQTSTPQRPNPSTPQTFAPQRLNPSTLQPSTPQHLNTSAPPSSRLKTRPYRPVFRFSSRGARVPSSSNATRS